MIKKILRTFISKKIRLFLWALVPKFHKINTYEMDLPKRIEPLSPIANYYTIRFINSSDVNELKNFYSSKEIYESKIPPRLKHSEWKGLAVFDSRTNKIGYLAWIIDNSIPYLEEFGIKMTENQFLLKDGHCKTEYRHQGLHTRMEQERINYCVKKAAEKIFIQIHDSNTKGKESVLANGYKLLKQDRIIQWPVFAVYRNLKAFVLNPFKKIVK